MHAKRLNNNSGCLGGCTMVREISKKLPNVASKPHNSSKSIFSSVLTKERKTELPSSFSTLINIGIGISSTEYRPICMSTLMRHLTSSFSYGIYVGIHIFFTNYRLFSSIVQKLYILHIFRSSSFVHHSFLRCRVMRFPLQSKLPSHTDHTGNSILVISTHHLMHIHTPSAFR